MAQNATTSKKETAAKSVQTTGKQEIGGAAKAEAAKQETEKKETVAAPVKEEPEAKTSRKTTARTTTRGAARKTAARKTPGRKAAKKSTTEVKPSVFVQYQGMEYSEADIMGKVVAAWEAEGKKAAAIKRVKLYVKPEDGKAYYVINERLKNGSTGAVDL